MITLYGLIGSSLSAVAGGLLLCGTLQAQTSTLRGQVVDATGQPLGGIEVVLHRVSESEGAEVGRTSSGPDGRFAIDYAPVQAPGLYFAATRVDGSIYMGVPFRSADELAGEYAIVVGGGGVMLPAETSDPGPPPSRLPVLLLVTGALALIIVAKPVWEARGPVIRARSILLELAMLEDAAATPPSDAPGPAPEALRSRRDTLRARLRDLSRRMATDAADQR